MYLSYLDDDVVDVLLSSGDSVRIHIVQKTDSVFDHLAGVADVYSEFVVPSPSDVEVAAIPVVF